MIKSTSGLHVHVAFVEILFINNNQPRRGVSLGIPRSTYKGKGGKMRGAAIAFSFYSFMESQQSLIYHYYFPIVDHTHDEVLGLLPLSLLLINVEDRCKEISNSTAKALR